VRLRVLSYNVHGLRDDRDALLSVVRDVEPDVVVIQEAPRRLRWRTRCATLARDVGLLYAVGGGPGLGNLILVGQRVRVHEAWCVRFPLVPGRHLRGAAFARASAGGVSFVLAGSHLSTDPELRRDQAYLLGQAVRAARGTGAAVILGVDVNEPPGGPAWQALAAGTAGSGAGACSGVPVAGGDAIAGGLVDGCAAQGAADAGAPVGLAGDSAALVDAGGPDAAPSFPARGASQRIDAVLVDPALHVDACRVLDGAAARRASDHLPILVDVVLPTKPV
jgi:endonuclease/exonuclease/phosphatase family metal-dependent hydrolase